MFKIFAGISKLGWRHGVGDTLRGAGNVDAVLTLPLYAPKPGTRAAPMFRIRVSNRSCFFEVRVHDSSRCTRGRWQRLEKRSRPGGAKAWSGLARKWKLDAEKYAQKNGSTVYDWANDKGKNKNECHTRANTDHLFPRLSGGNGRGRAGKGRPTSESILGFTPANGRKLGREE